MTAVKDYEIKPEAYIKHKCQWYDHICVYIYIYTEF